MISRGQARKLRQWTPPREIADWVKIYTAWDDLLPPERVVLKRFRERLGAMVMLDIGVGGGRTTYHFAPLVRQYVGIDVDPAMVEACLRRFPHRPSHVQLMVCDAREMSAFGDGAFDFVLFSYNGLDYLAHGDRLLALREIARVTRPATGYRGTVFDSPVAGPRGGGVEAAGSSPVEHAAAEIGTTAACHGFRWSVPVEADLDRPKLVKEARLLLLRRTGRTRGAGGGRGVRRGSDVRRSR